MVRDLLRQACSSIDTSQHPRHAGRDRRRLRRQDRGLPRAGGDRAVAQGRRPVKMVMTRDEVFRATGPTLAAPIERQDRREEGRHASSPPKCELDFQAGAFPGSPVGAGLHVPPRLLRHRQRPHRRLRRRHQPAQGRGLPRARRADRRRSRRERASTSWRSKLGMDPIDLRLKNARDEGHQDRLRRDVQDRSASSRRSRPPRTSEHYQSPLAAEPGPRRRLRLLVQRGGETRAPRSTSARTARSR